MNVYGFCPKCGAPGKFRERRIDGNDICEKGHKYPSKSALINNKASAPIKDDAVFNEKFMTD